MTSIEEYNYDLPEDRIAQNPLDQRSDSKLLVLDRQQESMQDGRFEEVLDLLDEGDALVLNNTKVLPTRLYGIKPKTHGHFEVLMTKNLGQDEWEVLINPGRRAKEGVVIEFGDRQQLRLEVLEVLDDGVRRVRFDYEGIFLEVLNEVGQMPLPPYIHEKLEDKDRYQTVYAKNNGSAAAPTAGLHFTEELLKKIEDKGVRLVYLTLHVGLGTFGPVFEEEIENHRMHWEAYELTEEACQELKDVKASGGKIVAVGTTVIRTLESIAQKHGGHLQAERAETNLFIRPGFQFQVVDQLLTNFHLPKSTLLMLVSAFASKDFMAQAYQHAIDNDYRFFSFGDAMFIK